MNCMSKKVLLRKEQLAYERKKAEEEKYLSTLSEEERSAYLKNKEERGRLAFQLFTELRLFTSGVLNHDILFR